MTKNTISNLSKIIEKTSTNETNLSDYIVEKDYKHQFPIITIVDIKKENIFKRYNLKQEIVEQYVKECISDVNVSIFHNEELYLVIFPLLNKKKEVIACIVGDYKSFYKNKIVTINQTFIYILFVIIFVTFISIILTIIFSYHITHPITQLIEATKTIAKGDLFHKINISSNDEIGVLVSSFNDMIKKQKIMNDEIREQQLFMIHQSRLAQMGEIISMIAHQWRQPLHSLTLLIQVFAYKYENGKLDDDLMKEFNKNSNKQIQNMSKTIDEFRNFFKPHNKKVDFSVNDVIVSCLDMLNPIFTKYGLFIKFENEGEVYSNGYPNELAQALINILNNAKDALFENNIKDKKIEIKLEKIKNKIVLSVFDNAGGIADDIIDKIFDPYFSTKDKDNGTGLGLYMSKLIIQDHMNGDIKVVNTEVGACFRIYLQGDK
ncbi:MAG: HAMP domain-containing histidine kinase [Sulfurimonas sp.]|nr:HAMP domain-containing histidine kinase [Sulfurimonas sp.]